ncbi:MAG TPA: hypothetical protein VJ841_01420 [Candidatus Saccharimonadales bacterium]|nr:hypothetical protein [Candidatus Saccharimonadales bacterium]
MLTRIRQFGAKVRRDFASYLLFASLVLFVATCFLVTIGRLLWSQDWSGLNHWVSANHVGILSGTLYALLSFHVGMCIYAKYRRSQQVKFFNLTNLFIITFVYVAFGHFVWPTLIDAAMLPILVTTFNLYFVHGVQASDCVVYLAGLTLVAVVIYRPVRHVWRYVSLRLSLYRMQSAIKTGQRLTIEDSRHLLKAYYAEKGQS